MPTEFVNPPRVQELLIKYHSAAKTAQDWTVIAKNKALTEWEQARIFEESAANLREELRRAVEADGNYKDDNCAAYIEERVSVSYDLKEAKACLPANILSMVIVQAVDTNAVKGLLKGKLLTEDQLKLARVEKITKAFIVR